MGWISYTKGKQRETFDTETACHLDVIVPLLAAAYTTRGSTDRQRISNRCNKCIGRMRKWKGKEFLVHSDCSTVKMERYRVPFTPSELISLSLPPSSPHPSSLVPLQAVFVEHCTRPLTCHHFASLGPLAANPEICTWEAEGVLRSPNQPSFLKEWATSNKRWRRAARGSECCRGGALLRKVGKGPGGTRRGRGRSAGS